MSFRIRASGALLFAAAFILSAQAPRALNPAYLAEMPPPDRVFREITATDPVEKATRQAGAFQHLDDIILELSGPRAPTGNYTPDEQRIMNDYRTARIAAMKSVEERFVPELRRYDDSPALRDEILTRFFSPAFRERSLSNSLEMQRRIAILRQTAPAFGGTPQRSSAAPTPAAPAPARPVNAAPLPPDPSILKARAAKVDTNVFGIPLGERLSLPVCSAMASIGMTSTSCVIEGMLGGMTSAVTALVQQGTDNKYDVKMIRLAPANCPSWISDGLIAATLENGRLVGVAITPDGAKVETATSAELRGKYGRPYMARERHITQIDGGSAKFDVWDLEWILPGLHVEYRVVEETIYKGRITIELESLHAVRSTVKKEAARPKL